MNAITALFLFALVAIASSQTVIKNSKMQISVNAQQGSLTMKVLGKDGKPEPNLNGTYVMNFVSITEIDKDEKPVTKPFKLSQFKVAKNSNKTADAPFEGAEITSKLPNGATFSMILRLYNNSKKAKVAVNETADNSKISISESAGVFAFAIKNFDFKDKKNQLYVATTIMNSYPLKNATTQIKSNKGLLKSIHMEGASTKKLALYMTFPTDILVDGKTSTDFTTNSSVIDKETKNLIGVDYMLPYFKEHVFVDPNFGYGPVPSSSGSKTNGGNLFKILAIVGGVIAAIILAAIIVTVVRRNKKSSYEEI